MIKRKRLYVIRGFSMPRAVKFVDILKSLGYAEDEAKCNKNFSAVVAGYELGFLNKDDIAYMLKDSTSEIQAGNRLITKRRRYYGEL